MMSASSTIKRIRQEAMLNITEFASEIGVSRQAIHSYETGKTKPIYPIIRKIKKYADEHNIEVKVQEFFDDED